MKRILSNLSFNIIFLILMILKIRKKTSYHIDELFSYGSSNRNLYIKFKQNRYYDPKILQKNYLTVDKKSRFNYRKVWKNQAMDVHLTFYYALLHTICSFFPGKFSPWFAGSINIFFSSLTLYFLRKICLILSNNNEHLCNIISFLYIFSPGILNSICFFRMYVSTMFFITILSYVILNQIDNEEYSFQFFVKIYFIIVFGILVHYYFIFFTFFIFFNFLILLILKQKFKFILNLIITGLLSIITSFLIFPNMITHFFYKYREKESLHNLLESKNKFFFKIQKFYSIISNDLFINHFMMVILLIIFLIFENLFLEKNKKKLKIKEYFKLIFNNKKLNKIILKYSIIFISCLYYFLLITKIAIFNVNRYIVPIYCITFILIMNLFFLLIIHVCHKKYFYYSLILLVISIFLNEDLKILYVQMTKIPIPSQFENYYNLDCIYIYNKIWKTLFFTIQMKNCKRIKFIKKNNMKKDIFYKEKNSKKFLIIYLMNIKM